MSRVSLGRYSCLYIRVSVLQLYSRMVPMSVRLICMLLVPHFLPPNRSIDFFGGWTLPMSCMVSVVTFHMSSLWSPRTDPIGRLYLLEHVVYYAVLQSALLVVVGQIWEDGPVERLTSLYMLFDMVDQLQGWVSPLHTISPVMVRCCALTHLCLSMWCYAVPLLDEGGLYAHLIAMVASDLAGICFWSVSVMFLLPPPVVGQLHTLKIRRI